MELDLQVVGPIVDLLVHVVLVHFHWLNLVAFFRLLLEKRLYYDS